MVVGFDWFRFIEYIVVMDLMVVGLFVFFFEDDLNLVVLLKLFFIGIIEDELFEVVYDWGGVLFW